jgi:hypothetical protein
MVTGPLYLYAAVPLDQKVVLTIGQDDMLTWLMQRENGQNMNYRGVIARLMNINLASTHTTSMVH